MPDKVFKNHLINIGAPFQVKVPYFNSAEQGDMGGIYASLADGATGDTIGDGMNSAVGAIGIDVDDIPIDEEAAAQSVLESARAQADEILNTARAESAEMIAAASSETNRIVEAARREARMYAEKIREQAETEAAGVRERAMREGDGEGRAQGRAAYDTLIDEADRLRAEANEEYIRLLGGAEKDALELVLAIAKKVIGDELEQNRGSLLSMISDAFARCANREDVVLKVSSGDYDFVSENRDALLSMSEGVDKLEIRRDLSLAAGSCLVDTPFGSVDAGAATRMSRIEDAFYTILSTSRSHGENIVA